MSIFSHKELIEMSELQGWVGEEETDTKRMFRDMEKEKVMEKNWSS